jgi:SRSO17 transposase
VGKQENGIVTVHLGISEGDFQVLLDGDLFLPESWSQDRARCRAAGIPDEVVYRPKTEIALELYDRVQGNGLHFDWLTFDEWYGSKPPFLRALDDRNQRFVGEIHKDFVGWIDPPRITRRSGGGPRPQDAASWRGPATIAQLASHPALRDQPGRRVADQDERPHRLEGQPQ